MSMNTYSSQDTTQYQDWNRTKAWAFYFSCTRNLNRNKNSHMEELSNQRKKGKKGGEEK